MTDLNNDFEESLEARRAFNLPKVDPRVARYVKKALATSGDADTVTSSQAQAWFSVWTVLQAVLPDLVTMPGTGVENAVGAILNLADKAKAYDEIMASRNPDQQEQRKPLTSI